MIGRWAELLNGSVLFYKNGAISVIILNGALSSIEQIHISWH